MKLRKLEISTFKNLRNFSIDFSQKLTTVLLGQNGTGKSNLLEALIIIFRDLDFGETPAFQYKLDYECRNNEIHIDADPARGRTKREQVQILVRRGDEMPRAIPYNKQFYEDSERTYLATCLATTLVLVIAWRSTLKSIRIASTAHYYEEKRILCVLCSMHAQYIANLLCSLFSLKRKRNWLRAR